MMSESTTSPAELNVSSRPLAALRSGYDLPVYGLDDGNFLRLHVVALSLIFCSLACAIAVVVWSFRTHTTKFFTWSQGERIAVYMAFCDGLFNISHSLDHLHYVIQRDHVTPAGLCVFYAMFLLEFMTSQILLVNITAINAFTLVYRRRALDFGVGDRRLLLYVYGVPCVLAVSLAAAGQLGPSGAL
ncbi:uncharacterized protein LOC122392982 [Amphibalanus amphitrite]|uniref:uncharacterized protein LOC122392982 n=1 Tax=Amphibalanus amphitrite TaxID=1232801 RepID=UPI001C912700|nr:uncharacterized protein LOC122392982 [Amphibalanus amphitrite]